MGSSPHTRGALSYLRRNLSERGIIPAYAGSTHPSLRQRPHTGDHPRIRGEHSGSERRAPYYSGSSPHTRGAPIASAHSARMSRIIPAYAGSTRRGEPWRGLAADHPRIRGEHVSFGAVLLRVAGSSPHTRGARAGGRGIPPTRRIIPAYAGSTTAGAVRVRGRRDHPRIRGEHHGWEGWQLASEGSSPHTRGAPGRCGRPRHLSRIIPAYAGSTVVDIAEQPHEGDHPRIRGEHTCNSRWVPLMTGSSPHTRGAQGLGEICDKLGRIIPAYAGSTRDPHLAKTPQRDHPRIRGEHSPDSTAPCREHGSSPHTRGAR